MRRLLNEPVTLGLVALCVTWTLVARSRGLGYVEAGALTGRLLWEGELWRLLSGAILHHMGGWVHLAVNALSLLFVGRVVERACGRPVLVACVAGAAVAGFATSLLWDPDPNLRRMGISGGIAGLLGLVLAVEWAVTKGVLEFLRQRNTLIILLFVLLSVPLAEYVFTGLRVDHAGHAGGFAFGLLAGLSLYTRRGQRPMRGALVALLLAVVPAAYAAHPFLEPEYQIWRATRAYAEEDWETAADAFGRARELDSAALDRSGMREAFVDACLRLAAERLGGPEAKGLVEKARDLGGRQAGPWIRFADAAEGRGHARDAYLALREAATLLPGSEAWGVEGRALRLLRARGTLPPRETIEVARGAVRGLGADLSADARAALEREIAETADAVGRDAPPGSDVARDLGRLYRTLAENTAEDARRPGYRLRAAEWSWRGAGGAEPPEEVVAMFRAAITEAALYGDAATAEAAAGWFRDRGMAVPEPDLEGEEGGG